MDRDAARAEIVIKLRATIALLRLLIAGSKSRVYSPRSIRLSH